jgi:hypothetical protein
VAGPPRHSTSLVALSYPVARPPNLTRVKNSAADPVAADDPHLWPQLTGIYRPQPGLKTNMRLWPLVAARPRCSCARAI